ncbi:hypothetical protein NR798_38175 [Archangium gephyra]|uniref:hypothetical protein n=1 Tax=Archangium gephyra TaxID=48 RepID=UPI0035D4D363
MANGNPGEAQQQVSRFFILRTFSTIKPKKMASFMNAITWQAAWLRHRFQWDRVVVGYALTDIPERVLEIYGIPTDDRASAEQILATLHQQHEYQELKECCEGVREDDEILLPAMQYKTSLRDLMEPRMKEAGLNARRRELQRNRTVNRRQLLEFDKLQTDLAGAHAELERAHGVLSGAQGGLSGAQGVPGREGASADAQAVDAREAAREAVNRLGVRINEINKRIANLPPRPTLSAREAEFGTQLSEVNKELQEIQDAIKRQLEGIRIPDYFLNVSIKLSRTALPAYIEQMTKLLEEFAWDFIAAGEQLPPPGRFREGEEPDHEIMHLWRFGDANDLYRQMVGLRESKRYSAITQLLSEPERQMLMCDWEALSKTKRPSPIRSESREA